MAIFANNTNSYISDNEFFSFLDRRLNAEDFDYRKAIIEAGATDPLIIKYLNIGKLANSFEEIKAALDDYISGVLLNTVEYSLDELERAYKILAERETQPQTKAQQAIILATSLIDTYEFLGKPTSQAQPLQWPRRDVLDRNGNLVNETDTPHDIKTAVCELAFFLLKHDVTDPGKYNHLYLLTTKRVGESSHSYETKPAKNLPDIVLNYMRTFLVEKSDYSSCLIF